MDNSPQVGATNTSLSFVDKMKNFVKNNLKRDSFHKIWVDSYSSQEYQDVTNWLRNYVDEIGKNLNKKGIENCKELFRLGIEYEIGFWDSAWNFSNK